MLRLFTILFAGLTVTQVAVAHPAHNQITEVEWNGNSRRFEVAMRLDAAALEDSLSVRSGHRVRLESTQSVGRLVVDYLADRFEIDCRGTHGTGTLIWHGLELELHSAWLYFEFSPQFAVTRPSLKDVTGSPPASQGAAVPAEVRIRNQCVADVRPQTSHFIRLRCGDLKVQGHCDRSTPWAQLQQHRPVMRPLLQPVD